ncbi:DUF1501 domain-containing protein [Rubinisphaera margarita]|uniref:DUF1501 domain-containing protein n=1 Tax=Rubinisphaera margarita TaxID=2909586 RepID=UPI001EE9A118|nr:DUF1501 domain-containing protein [Rubinisphaera margarita]MCG6154749.1 DUF1501 domain-containing protein [Rubinisphaera margarita]
MKYFSQPAGLGHDGLQRRELLSLSAGLGLSFVLPGLPGRAAEKRGSERATSLITLWMHGGPSQLETWDPHPGTAIGGPTQAIETTIPGTQIAAHLPLMAEQLQHLSVIRSLVSKEGDHERGTYFVKTGYRPDPTVRHPAIGALVPYELKSSSLEIPAYVSLGEGQWPGRGGYLGDEYDAFRIFDPGQGLHNMRPRVGDRRQDSRIEGLSMLSQSFRRGRGQLADRTMHQRTVEQALTMMNSDQLKAFEIEEESETTRKQYGDTRFGRGCLVARRLIETGVRSVEVSLSGFDSHANNFEAHQNRAAELDPAFAALIQDLRARDLYDSTIVLCIGEFGRTPRINPLDGRDHWPTGFSTVVGGGGLRSGVVIGETDPTGENKDPADPIKVQDLYATILSQLSIDPDKELMTPIGRPLFLCEGTPLPQLLRS